MSEKNTIKTNLKSKSNLLIVEDHLITAEMLKMQVETISDYKVIGILQTISDIINFDKYSDIDAVISDYLLTDTNGIQIVKQIKDVNPDIKIIILSGISDANVIIECFKQGINGFISKESSISNVVNSIDCVIKGGNYMCEKTISTVMKKYSDFNTQLSENKKVLISNKALTKRENEILKLIADGEKNHQIAAKLYISDRTVETHRRNILKKFGKDNIIAVLHELDN